MARPRKKNARRPPGGPVECPFKIIIDTREQRPYTFSGLKSDVDEKRGEIEVEVVRGSLKHGDYQVSSMPEFCIERKSLDDLYGSISRRDNFVNRFQSMSRDGVRGAIVVEAELRQVIGHPPPFTKLHPKSVSRTIQAWSLRYPHVAWWFLADRVWAEAWTFRLLQRWWKDHQHGIPDSSDSLD
jgi:ERCC4-type nuclease